MARLIDELLVRDWRFPAGAVALPLAEVRKLRARIRRQLAGATAIACDNVCEYLALHKN